MVLQEEIVGRNGASMRNGSTARTEIGMITVNGQRLRVAIRPGTGTATPLLLMNGLGLSLELFQPFVDQLDPALEVIRFDVPGIGGSPLPTVPYCFSSLASLVARMLDQLGYKKVDVLGVSWGGGLAQQFAFQYSSHCRRLILACTAMGAVMVPGRLDAVASLMTPQHYTELSYLMEADPDLSREGLESESRAVREADSAIRWGSSRGYLYQVWAMLGWTSLPWLWLIRQPTLLLAGGEDPIVPPINSQIMYGLIPRSKLYVYKGGHMGLLTHARELGGVTSRFLTQK